jgi:hypothetical protein
MDETKDLEEGTARGVPVTFQFRDGELTLSRSTLEKIPYLDLMRKNDTSRAFATRNSSQELFVDAWLADIHMLVDLAGVDVPRLMEGSSKELHRVATIAKRYTMKAVPMRVPCFVHVYSYSPESYLSFSPRDGATPPIRYPVQVNNQLVDAQNRPSKSRTILAVHVDPLTRHCLSAWKMHDAVVWTKINLEEDTWLEETVHSVALGTAHEFATSDNYNSLASNISPDPVCADARVVARFLDSNTLLTSVSLEDKFGTWKTTVTLVTDSDEEGFTRTGEDRLVSAVQVKDVTRLESCIYAVTNKALHWISADEPWTETKSCHPSVHSRLAIWMGGMVVTLASMTEREKQSHTTGVLHVDHDHKVEELPGMPLYPGQHQLISDGQRLYALSSTMGTATRDEDDDPAPHNIVLMYLDVGAHHWVVVPQPPTLQTNTALVPRSAVSGLVDLPLLKWTSH